MSLLGAAKPRIHREAISASRATLFSLKLLDQVGFPTILILLSLVLALLNISCPFAVLNCLVLSFRHSTTPFRFAENQGIGQCTSPSLARGRHPRIPFAFNFSISSVTFGLSVS